MNAFKNINSAWNGCCCTTAATLCLVDSTTVVSINKV